jgi:hypothetical protein
MAGEAYSVGLPLTVVVPSAADSEAAALPNKLARIDTVQVLYDASATLASTVPSRGVTAVLVRRNGTISDIQPAVTASTIRQLGAPLQEFLLPTLS